MTESPPDPEAENARDVELMLAVQATGDHEAFRELIERHQNAVIGTVAKMLGNANEAEDIAQQVFLRLWKARQRYQPSAKFTTFLYTITRNLVFNETRRKSRRKESSLDQQKDEHDLELPANPNQRPDREQENAELRAAIDQAIEQLPEKQRLAVVLRRYQNLPYEEIAEVLDLTVSAVKSQLFRARTTLRESLASYLEH
ncbi:RNA polymerase sigma factor [Roseibacillus ishigakijimensis]|uniref:RNA polymerase sigma-70 factor n=1 Tax=Roseibacillus ishigakijimensis TaxID=454146 RepID=A0A934RQ73_9BACT|nr:RNA polymerase sigma-70 factor [Roseibacillus ishigakijimensis]MBK1834955.1 RNA polymerase sigma-70 factor [Roseibacillus ishigakijimensis]